jgi:uncharacterized membrane protein
MNEWLAKSWWRRRPFPRSWMIVLIILATLLILGFYTVTDPSRLAQQPLLSGADYAGYALCHRITARSFTIAGRQMPLCARCTGMYLGVALTFVLLGAAGRWRYSDLPPFPILIVLAAFVGLMGIDGLNSYSHFFPGLPHLYQPRNWLRLVTGLGTGLAMGAVVFPALAQTIWYEQERRSSIASWRELEGVVLAAGMTAVVLLSNQPAILYVLALVSAAGVVLILGAINSMILLIAFKRDALAKNWRQAAVPLAIGLGMALIQIALVSVFRYRLTGTMTGFPGM